MQLVGFGILQRTELALAGYLRILPPSSVALLQQLRDTAPFLDASLYRGIGRPWLDPIFLGEAQELEQMGLDGRTEARARRRFRELQAEVDDLDYDDELIADHGHAREVFSLLDNPHYYELIRVRRRDFAKDFEQLGYDIGYWGGDHFSLVADSFVTPLWHPPQPDAFEILAERLRPLNENLLFPTLAAAADFRDWYRGQCWAETEARLDEFEIIQLSAVELVL